MKTLIAVYLIQFNYFQKAMKNPVELRYLERPIGEQLHPHFAKRQQLRQRIPLINLPRLSELFGRTPKKL